MSSIFRDPNQAVIPFTAVSSSGSITETSVNTLTNKTISYDGNTLSNVAKTLLSTSTPGSTDDSSDNNSAGNVIVNTASDTVFVCTDATENNARWSNLTEEKFLFPEVVAGGSNVVALRWIVGTRPYNSFKILLTRDVDCEVSILNSTAESTIYNSGPLTANPLSVFTVLSFNQYYDEDDIFELVIRNGTISGMTIT
jgi:hypothetical protein